MRLDRAPAWPATPPPTGVLTLDGRRGAPRSEKHTVGLVARWWKISSDAESSPLLVSEARQMLRRDVDPDEEIRHLFGAALPFEDGLYELGVRVEQADGAHFTAPGNVAHRERVRIEDGRALLEPAPQLSDRY